MARELDDAILTARTNELELGIWLFKTSGNADAILAIDAQLQQHASNWFVREVTNFLRRTLSRLDVSSRSIYALIEQGSCFAGTLAELAFAADRTYMLAVEDSPEATFLALSAVNFGAYTMANSIPRIAHDLHSDESTLTWVVTAPLLAFAVFGPAAGKGHAQVGGAVELSAGATTSGLATAESALNDAAAHDLFE